MLKFELVDRIHACVLQPIAPKKRFPWSTRYEIRSPIDVNIEPGQVRIIFTDYKPVIRPGWHLRLVTTDYGTGQSVRGTIPNNKAIGVVVLSDNTITVRIRRGDVIAYCWAEEDDANGCNKTSS